MKTWLMQANSDWLKARVREQEKSKYLVQTDLRGELTGEGDDQHYQIFHNDKLIMQFNMKTTS